MNDNEKHVFEVEHLRYQCSLCKRRKPNTPTKDCDIRIKLVVNDSEVAWKHKYLFFHQPGNRCKMFAPVYGKKL